MEGGFGKLYLVRKVVTRDIYVVKVMDKRSLSQKNEMWCARVERDVLTSTDNEFVVRMFYSFASRDQIFIVMEYLPGGDLFDLLQKNIVMDEDMARFYAAEMVLALEYLHSRGIIHRDVKPDNVLLTSEGHIKLTDFGLSQKGLLKKQAQGIGSMLCRGCPLCDGVEIEDALDPDRPPPPAEVAPSSPLFATCPLPRHSPGNPTVPEPGAPTQPKVPRALGTPEYIAPEVLLGLPHDKEVDWWGLGCVLYALMCGFPPFAGESIDEIFDNVISKRIDWPDGVLSREARDVIDRLLALSPEKRLGVAGAEEIKRHPFFRNINWATLRKTAAPYRPVPDGLDWQQQLRDAPAMSTPGHLTGQHSGDDDDTTMDEFLWVNFASLAQQTRDALRRSGSDPSTLDGPFGQVLKGSS